MRGATDAHTYRPNAEVVLAGGRSYSAYHLGTSGAANGSRAITVGAASTSAPSGARAIVEGRPCYRIDAGSLREYWLPEQTSVSVVLC